jgi:hypothetical protein
MKFQKINFDGNLVFIRLKGFLPHHFLVANFHHFAKNILKKEYPVTNSLFKEKFLKKSPKIATVSYNINGCLRFSTFIS